MDAYQGYEIVELDGLPVLRCLDCRAWSRPGQRVRHTSRCDLSGYGPVFSAPAATGEAALEPRRGDHLTAAQVRSAGRRGEISAVMSDSEVLEAVRAGVLSESAAMNRDY